MKYAFIGDIHSSLTDLQAVFTQIKTEASDATIIGTGDLFECTISKKDINGQTFTALADVLINDKGFSDHLTFPSVVGNQEERILAITKTEEPLRQWIAEIPEIIEVEGARVIHGHQWTWGGNPWALQEAKTPARLTFYGHSHTSGLFRNGKAEDIIFNEWIDVQEGRLLVNVGSVIDHREWVLYDATSQKIMFKKVGTGSALVN